MATGEKGCRRKWCRCSRNRMFWASKTDGWTVATVARVRSAASTMASLHNTAAASPALAWVISSVANLAFGQRLKEPRSRYQALALAEATSVTEPGAHRVPLTVSFAPTAARVAAQCTLVASSEIDANPAAFDNQPIEINITAARPGPSNNSLLPSGFSPDDYAVYSVAAIGDATRTRLAVIIRLDTAVNKLFSHTNLTDMIRVRGMAHVPLDSGALSIVADTAETIGSSDGLPVRRVSGKW
jgi:hypothetical protein